MNKQQLEIRIQNIRHKIEAIKTQYKIEHDIIIVAATKTKNPETINMLPECGINVIGENRVQELIEKYPYIDQNLEKHFIGQLQTNKVKYIIDKVSLIHSLDRLSLAQEIEKQAIKIGQKIDVLIEVNMGEQNKGGVAIDDVVEFYQSVQNQYPDIVVRGLMSVMPINTDEGKYLQISKLYGILKAQSDKIKYLSVGMSDDYLTAIKYGANMIRLGRAVLGERNT